MYKFIILKMSVILMFSAVIYINYLANSLPFNNTTTGEISSKYATLFTPSGSTFSIWGIIYLLVGMYVVRFAVTPHELIGNNEIMIALLFLISCVGNMLWLYTWHYDYIGWSTVMMSVLLISLGFIFYKLDGQDTITISAFSTYFAWINVAFIANIAIFIVKQNSSFFLSNALLFFIIILVVGVVIVTLVSIRTNNVIFGLVFIWAYLGILSKHLNKQELYTTNQFALFLQVVLILVLSGITIVTFIQNQFKLY